MSTVKKDAPREISRGAIFDSPFDPPIFVPFYACLTRFAGNSLVKKQKNNIKFHTFDIASFNLYN